MDDGQVRTGDGPTFHPGERLLLEFPQMCGSTSAPKYNGTVIVDLTTRLESSPSVGPVRKVPRTTVMLEYHPRLPVGRVKFVLPESLPPESYVLNAYCVVPNSDTGPFFARWDVEVESEVKDIGSAGELVANFEGGRAIHLQGSARSNNENVRIATVRILSKDCEGDCLVKFQGLIFEYDVSYELVDGKPRGIDAEVVLPDSIPAGEYLMTPGPDGVLSPVAISLGEP